MLPYRKSIGKLKTHRKHASDLALARVLLVDDDPTSRLTLQTVLQASGYHVDSAASAAEAVGRMDEAEYELVLTDLHLESPDAGYKVLAHARMMEYEPAAALISSSWSGGAGTLGDLPEVLIAPEDVPELLTKVANLIAERATRRMARELRHNYALSF